MTMQTTNALTLPDADQFRHDIQAINRFQQVVHASMIEGQDYGVIPGTSKPTLLKPGAEKIAKLLKLADHYEIVNSVEDWDKPLFRYLIRCRLVHIDTGTVISEGLGECNSMEGRYRWRWVKEADIPDGIDAGSLVRQQRTSSNGGKWFVFRVPNDDIYSQVNTLLKLAKKRALVDAALSAGRLSDVFTQDLEDLPKEAYTTESAAERSRTEEPDKTQHWCEKHHTPFFKKGKMKGYAHPIAGSDVDWCDEPAPKKAAPSKPVQPEPEPPEPKTGEPLIDMEWLKESLETLNWNDCSKWLHEQYNVPLGRISVMFKALTDMQQEAFAEEIERRLKVHSGS